jgi:hypothetical protein
MSRMQQIETSVSEHNRSHMWLVPGEKPRRRDSLIVIKGKQKQFSILARWNRSRRAGPKYTILNARTLLTIGSFNSNLSVRFSVY